MVQKPAEKRLRSGVISHLGGGQQFYRSAEPLPFGETRLQILQARRRVRRVDRSGFRQRASDLVRGVSGDCYGWLSDFEIQN